MLRQKPRRRGRGDRHAGLGDSARNVAIFSQDFPGKLQHRGVELLGPLQWREMTDAIQEDKLRLGKGPGQIFRMFAFDEFVMVAVRDRDGYSDLREIACGVVGLGPLHQADSLDEAVEFFWELLWELRPRSRELGVVPCVAREAAVQCGSGFKWLCAARVHVAGKEEHTCNARGGVRGQD